MVEGVWMEGMVDGNSSASLYNLIIPPTMNLRNQGAISELNHALTNSEARRTLLIIWLLLLSLYSLGVSATRPALTINSPDGDIVDCVYLREQPAFRHLLLQNHEIQEPTHLPDNMVKSQNEEKWQTWHESGLQCPQGTIPIRRVNETGTIEAGVEATHNHEYAVGTINRLPPKIYGVKATMNVWEPKIEQLREFSLGQVWLVSGSYNNNDVNSIEAGWQVYPDFYLDYHPRLFIFWTKDAYNLTKCYNLRCPGFVQTSSTVLIEGAISPTSVLGGRQTELTIQIWKEPNAGPWWLGIGLNNGTVLSPIGYWPTSIFTRLTDHAEYVQWGGEIVNLNISGRHTSTQMGSGYLSNNANAAYMRDLQVAVNISQFQPAYNLVVAATNSTYYSTTKLSNTSFAYGGPEHAGGVRLSLAFLFYLYLTIFLFF